MINPVNDLKFKFFSFAFLIRKSSFKDFCKLSRPCHIFMLVPINSLCGVVGLDIVHFCSILTGKYITPSNTYSHFCGNIFPLFSVLKCHEIVIDVTCFFSCSYEFQLAEISEQPT